MATIKLPASPQSAVSKIPIVGTPLEVAEVKNIPPQLLFRYASVKPSLLQKVINKVTDVVTFKSTGPPRQPYRCPRCQASDPDVTVPVMNACSIRPSPTVDVECVNGHWARYPCPGL